MLRDDAVFDAQSEDLSKYLSWDNTAVVLPPIGSPNLNPGKFGALTTDFKDPRDGNVYRTVKIGNQVWMAENLNYSIDGSWCYDNDDANGKKYGRLYTWNAAKAACPAGWRLPTRQEWDKLVLTVGGSSIAGKKLKAADGWKEGGGNGADEYGFSARPGGYRGYGSSSFFGGGECGDWWTATELNGSYVYCRDVYYNCDYVKEGYNHNSSGLSVRCVAN